MKKALLFTGGVLPASEGAALGLVTKLSNTPVIDSSTPPKDVLKCDKVLL